ncbi:MAG: carboxypeptidase-like regulatory domain-containing protein, partial [Proteobacteria bacterium]|nr:carboxypeptidase-like regulatory domain-containing protein [Pseudomonadota bacterium]
MLVLAGWTAAWSAQAQTGSRLPTVTSFDIPIAGLSATLDPPEPVIPKNTDSGVLVVVRAGDRVLATQEVAEFLGGPFEVQAELSGPGLERTITVPQLALSDPPPEDPLVLRLPPLPMAGDYALANVRLVRDGKPVLDATPLQFTVKVIDQVLITSVKTRPLTLDEIRDKGIVLSSDDYVGFEFTLGMATESQSVSFSLPVAFDRQGVPVPAVIKPPSSPPRAGVSVAQDLPEPLIVPTLLEVEDLKALNIPDFDGTLRAPSGEPIRIPSVLVIPGNVGYLKQFFSAQLFVANGAPVGSGLTVRDVQGTVKLPAGADRVPGSADDPLVLPETVRGVQPETLPVRGVGLDGVPDTADDTVVLKAAEQGQAEFLIRGEQEGFHSIEFDIAAVLDGLPIGPVDVRGKARGGVLVRNPFFDMTFTIPSVVRAGEPFSVFATVNHIGKGIANDLSVALTAASLSGARAAGDLEQRIPTLLPGDARTLEYRFVAQRTGQVVATYLKLDTSAPGAGKLKWSLGVGERGVALSPDTLVLPAGVDGLPREVVAAAMRVLGQAWSISNAAAGTLPPDVLRIPRSVTTARALALAEAGLRVSLGQDPRSAARDLAFDFYGGEPLDAAFDQLLRETQAGHAFARAVGTALASEMHAAGGLLPFGQEIDAVAVSGADFLRFAVGSGSGAPPVEVTLLDDVGRRSDAPAAPDVPPVSEIAGAVWIPMGATSAEALVGLLTQVNSPLYTLELKGTGPGVLDLSLTQPRGDGSFVRGELTAVPVTAATRARLLVDRRRPETLVLEVDANGDGSYESSQALRVEAVASSGPQLVSASVVGPETIDGASPFGFQVAVLFDRIVDADSAAVLDHYVIPQNGMQSAQRQLSGRFVFGSLEQPEGPYVPSTLAVSGMRDQRGVVGPSKTVELVSTLEDPGAVISGRVVGPDGGAVTTGTVTYQNNSNWECLPSLFEQESSPIAAGFAAVELDGQGRYEFRYVRQDACGFPWILATRDPRTGSLQRASGFVSTAGEHVVLDFALLGQGVVRGTVRDLRGNVVSGAQVAVVSQTDPQVGGVTTTDGSGRYTVYGITVGQVSVTAAKGTGVGRASGNVGRAGGTASVDVTLDGSATSVAGQVRIVEGVEQREGVGVTVVYEAKGTTIAVTQTDRAGAFSFENVPAGPFTLKAALNTRDSAKIHGTAVAGQPLTGQVLVIHVPVAGAPQPGPGYGSVQGLVSYADGVPASDVVVSIAGRGVVSAADGSFEIPGVPVDPSAPHTVLAQSRDGLRSGQAQVYVTQSEQIVEGVVVVLSGLGSAEFRVLDSKGAPLVGQEVGLLGRCKAACGCNPATTDSHGMARFDGLPIGAVHARAVRAGTGFADVASASASITRDGEVATGTLQFAGAGSVSGVVRDAAGSPVFGADVVLRSKVFVSATCSLGHGVAQRVRTNTRGEYRFRAVNLGPVSVTASQTFLPVPVSATDVLTVPGQELALDLTLLSGDASFAGQLSGTVLLPDGVTPAGAGIEVTADGVLPDVVVSTDAVGHFAFAKILPEGRYTLTARDPVTGGVAKTAVFLRANQDAQQNLRLLGRGVVRVSVQDAAGLPVDNAFVRVREAGFTGGLHEGAVEASNLGVVRFENVFEGPLSIEASDVFGRGGRASALLADPGTTLDVTVRLSMTGSVAGIFVAADGATPVPFGAVTLTAGGRVIGRTTTTGSGRDVGRFRFDHVPAGAVRVDAQDPSTARTGFALGNIERQDQIVELTLRAHGLGTVEGLVSGDGRPQPGAEVTLIAGPLGAHTVADAQGRYRVTGIPEGEVAVTASLGNGFLVGTAAAHLMGDGSTLELNVRLRSSGRVLGRVLNADGLTPAPPSIVSIRVGGAGGGE